MKRSILLFALLGFLGLVAVTIPVAAEEDPPPLPPHPHLLLQKAEIVFTDQGPVVTYKRCVDLAANKAVPLHAHHEKLHVGESGVSGLVHDGASGHIVIPAAPLVPWGSCAEFATIFPPG